MSSFSDLVVKKNPRGALTFMYPLALTQYLRLFEIKAKKVNEKETKNLYWRIDQFVPYISEENVNTCMINLCDRDLKNKKVEYRSLSLSYKKRKKTLYLAPGLYSGFNIYGRKGRCRRGEKIKYKLIKSFVTVETALEYLGGSTKISKDFQTGSSKTTHLAHSTNELTVASTLMNLMTTPKVAPKVASDVAKVDAEPSVKPSVKPPVKSVIVIPHYTRHMYVPRANLTVHCVTKCRTNYSMTNPSSSFADNIPQTNNNVPQTFFPPIYDQLSSSTRGSDSFMAYNPGYYGHQGRPMIFSHVFQ